MDVCKNHFISFSLPTLRQTQILFDKKFHPFGQHNDTSSIYFLQFTYLLFLHTYFQITGHCVTPVAYHYDPETTRLIMKEFNSDNMKKFLKEYTSYSSHQIGTSESHLFANNISELWSQFGLSKVELSQVKNVIPQPDAKMPSKITITL